MPEFLTPVDIANRGLDHCGQGPLDATLGFAESSPKGRITGRIYPKLREAELRRNVWRFAIKKTVLRPIDANFMLLTPSLWVASTTYFVGSIVADDSGRPWISRIPNNLNNDPQNTPAAWEQYFGPMAVPLYAATTSYEAGELAYTTAGDGTYRVYLSLQNGNDDDPATATDWDATTVYFKNQVVTFSSIAYMSLIDLNTNQTPTSSPANWASGTTYALNDLVNGSDNVTYKSLAGGNLGNDPISSPASWLNMAILTPWTTVFTGGTGSLKWLQIGGAEFPFGVGLATLNIIYPLGSGPSSQTASRNAFRLPANFLRKAPQDPKAGSTSALGMATNRAYDDWNLEGDYLVSSETGNITFRFVADFADVSRMDPMFCEMLGARIGLEICEPLTQSAEKTKTIADFYNKFGVEARTVNGIETGSVEPPLDDYIACRF